MLDKELIIFSSLLDFGEWKQRSILLIKDCYVFHDFYRNDYCSTLHLDQ